MTKSASPQVFEFIIRPYKTLVSEGGPLEGVG